MRSLVDRRAPGSAAAAAAAAESAGGEPPSALEFELDDAPAIEALLRAYARPVRVRDLPHPPHEELEDKLGVAEALFREGFLYALEDGEEEDAASDEDEEDDAEGS